MTTIQPTPSLNKILLLLKELCDAHYMKPSFQFGPVSDINAQNNIVLPIIWCEPSISELDNSIQGLKVESLGLNLYALDRINKGENNFQELMSDMLYLLETLLTQIRESGFFRILNIKIDGNQQLEPLMRETDEDLNGYLCRFKLRIATRYTPCNNPIGPIGPTQSPPVELDVNLIDGGSDDILNMDSLFIFNLIDAGTDQVNASGSTNDSNLIDAGTDITL